MDQWGAKGRVGEGTNPGSGGRSHSIAMTQARRREDGGDTSEEEAAPLTVLMSAAEPPADLSQRLYHSKVEAAPRVRTREAAEECN